MSPPGFNTPKSSSGSSAGLRIALVVAALVAVAGGFITLSVLYWRHTRPTPAQ